MKLQFLSHLILGLSFSVVAHAVPQVEPSLARLLNSPQESERAIGVMLTYKDVSPVPPSLIFNRGGMERAMIINANNSQAQTLRSLQEMSARESAGRITFNRYWLTNSIALRAPARVVKQLLQDNAMASARLMITFRIVRPFNHGFIGRAAEPFTYGLQKLRIPDLRLKTSTADGRGVRVGILDTGIDAAHPDLKGKVLVFKDFVNGKTSPYDDHSHGTHVAGTISGGNASGTAIGVAPGVKLIIGKIFDADGSASEEQIQNGMQWIADPDGNPDTNDGPMLVSNSWGGGLPSGDPANEAECKAVDAWVKLGILPVFAAGNEGPQPRTVGLPAACPSALAIGATDEKDGVASFSSRGPAVWSNGSLLKPQVSAPGVRVFSSIPGGKYGSMSGTSMATPHTAGLAALVYQAHPNFRPDAIAKLLMAGTIDLAPTGPDQDSGYGRLDAMKALEISFGIRQ